LAGSENLANSLKTITDSQNISFLDAARSAGYSKTEDDLSSVFLKKGTYSAFVELHIEQGPILEDEGTHHCANTMFVLAKTSMIINNMSLVS
jgi:ureidoglycolate amidohydrolase